MVARYSTAALLVCDDLWTSDGNELGYVPELKIPKEARRKVAPKVDC